MEGGFITLHRKITQWEWYDDIPTCRLFIHLLLVVNHEDREWHRITIKRGQKLTSYEKLAKDTKLSVKQVRTALNHLKSTGEVTCKSTHRYTLVTVEKYDDYQSEKKRKARKRASQAASKGQARGKQGATNNNDNNDNNDNKKQLYGEFQNVLLTDSEFEKLKDRFTDYQSKIENLSTYLESTGKKYKSHYATILAWERRESGRNNSADKTKASATDFSEYDDAIFRE